MTYLVTSSIVRKRATLSRGALTLLTGLALAWGALCPFHGAFAEDAAEEGWIALFNGRDLDDWNIKFKRHPLGVNYKDTFRVEDGVLKVSYDNYEGFDNDFGHIFYKEPFSHYLLRVEYRFVGEQVPGGPGWAFRNNGVMLHCQDPESMTVDQDFPVSVEVQLLGGDGEKERTTGNMCSPGTHVVIEDKLVRQHCYNSTSETYHGDQWVTIDIEVRGNKSIKHIIDGRVVLEYEEPQLDDRDPDAKALIAAGAAIELKQGYIALQAESHPTEFRRIDLKPLSE